MGSSTKLTLIMGVAIYTDLMALSSHSLNSYYSEDLGSDFSFLVEYTCVSSLSRSS